MLSVGTWENILSGEAQGGGEPKAHECKEMKAGRGKLRQLQREIPVIWTRVPCVILPITSSSRQTDILDLV